MDSSTGWFVWNAPMLINNTLTISTGHQLQVNGTLVASSGGGGQLYNTIVNTASANESDGFW